MNPPKKVRFRWRRIITIVIGGYLLFWAGTSLGHIWTLSHQEAALRQNIIAEKSQNLRLHQDIHQLRQPSTLKAILTGRAPLPTNVNTTPSSPP